MRQTDRERAIEMEVYFPPRMARQINSCERLAVPPLIKFNMSHESVGCTAKRNFLIIGVVFFGLQFAVL